MIVAAVRVLRLNTDVLMLGTAVNVLCDVSFTIRPSSIDEGQDYPRNCLWRPQIDELESEKESGEPAVDHRMANLETGCLNEFRVCSEAIRRPVALPCTGYRNKCLRIATTQMGAHFDSFKVGPPQ